MAMDFQFLQDVARDLPIIRPIKEFIHLNLLLPFQHLNFWDALLQVSSRFEAMPLADIKFYREKILSKDIPMELLEQKIRRYSLEAQRDSIMSHILHESFEFTHHDSRVGRLHEHWNDLLKINVIQLSDGMLIKWLGMFLDQGIGHWEMPGSDQQSFYHCIKQLLQDSYFRPEPFNQVDLRDFFPSTPEEAIEEHLKFLCPDVELQREYCEESILTLRGWAGIIFSVQQNPALLSFRRNITLVDFLAVKLVLERAWIRQENVDGLTPEFRLVPPRKLNPILEETRFLAFRICQEALEEVSYKRVLDKITENAHRRESEVEFQAVFCMDDRECSLRRRLEDLSPKIETYGTAGHFGIECMYQHHDDVFPKKQCPAPMQPKYLLKDVSLANYYAKSAHTLSFDAIQPSSNILGDWVFSHLNAVKSAVKLGFNLFFPLAFENLQNVIEKKPDTELKILRDASAPFTEDGLKPGYTPEEMADVVFSQLKLIGFVHHLAPLVFIVGHGSNTSNNPYFATYGCGACSGRPGSANARAFAHMANHPEVRKIVATKYGLSIPASTHFVAAFHDTTKDVVKLFDTHLIPEGQRKRFLKYKKYLSLALYKNAKERCQSFKRVTYAPISKDAQKEVIRRSLSFFETRPELGHTNVCFSIVARRNLTYGLNLGRRSFLQSYDPTVDPDGKLLAASLGAVIPVTSGISLDYFFSRVDNIRFGAGSKLPQNIVGNFGVSHGTESDLLFGLPFQMIDQHQPLRLLVLVEQRPEIALSAIQENPLVRQIVYNNWVYYAAISPLDRKFYFFKEGQMIESDLSVVL